MVSVDLARVYILFSFFYLRIELLLYTFVILNGGIQQSKNGEKCFFQHCVSCVITVYV